MIENKGKIRLGKRIFDIVFSLFAIAILMPIMIIIAVLIKVNSPEGTVLFRQKRLGLKGKIFEVLKFRTMVPNAELKLQEMFNRNPKLKEEFEETFKLKNDPRIISTIGSFLRKSSLDELPQFFNSLMGTMSIVGPRPIIQVELKMYGEFQKKFLSIKPGITGLWQVSGRNDINYEERVLLDMKYIDMNSFFEDIKIILKTTKVMLIRNGSY